MAEDQIFVGHPESVVREKGEIKISMKYGGLRERRFPIEDGEVYLTIWSEHPELHWEIGAIFDIAFGKDQVIDGESVIPALTRLLEITNSIIETMARKVF